MSHISMRVPNVENNMSEKRVYMDVFFTSSTPILIASVDLTTHMGTHFPNQREIFFCKENGCLKSFTSVCSYLASSLFLCLL